MPHRFQLHFVRISPLTGQYVFSLKIGIDHEHRGGIIIHLPYQNRNLRKPCQLSSMGTAMSGDDLITAAFQRSGDQRRQHTVLCDALRRSKHGFIINHLEGMILKGHQLADADILYSFQLTLCTALIRLKDIIVAGQADVSASFRHSEAPPLSDDRRPQRPCRPDRV